MPTQPQHSVKAAAKCAAATSNNGQAQWNRQGGTSDEIMISIISLATCPCSVHHPPGTHSALQSLCNIHPPWLRRTAVSPPSRPVPMFAFTTALVPHRLRVCQAAPPTCRRLRVYATAQVKHDTQRRLTDVNSYEEMYERSIRDPDAFWSGEAEFIEWEGGVAPRASPKHNFAPPNVEVEWFADGRTNACYNALDRWVEAGLGEKTCFYIEGNSSDSHDSITYAETLDKVQRVANALRDAGVGMGDRVVLYLPMIVELPVVMLACARIGAVHAVVFAGFSSEALAQRIVAADARVVVTCEYVVRGKKVIPLKNIADRAIEIAENLGKKVNTTFVVNAPEKVDTTVDISSVPARDISWNEAIAKAQPTCKSVWLPAEHPLFVLYTSGSTGTPKGVVHTTGGYLVYVSSTFRNTFDYRAGDVWFCTADCGWITGHSYVTYGPLLNGATQVLFGGVPTFPDAGRLWELCERLGVTHIYTAPTAVRALMGVPPPNGGTSAADWVKKYDLRRLRTLGSVGEPIGAEAWRWYFDVVGGGRDGVHVVDSWWQTETGGMMITSLPLSDAPEKPGCAMFPMPGVKPVLLAPESMQQIQGNNKEGLLAIQLPWPGMLRTTLGDHERMERTYFGVPGYYLTGDGARRDEDGHYWLTGRADDVINVSGHRIGSAEVEAAIGKVREVAEAAVVARPHPVKGEALYAYVALRAGENGGEELKNAIRIKVREEIGAFAAPDTVHWADALPKTRSGKIMRRILRTIAKEGRNTKNDMLGDTSTLTDATVVERLLDGVGK